MTADLPGRFDRIAILGPVDAAVRFCRTAVEVGEARGRPLQVVALHREPARADAVARMADEVVQLAGDGREALEEVLAAAAVDALWPGWGSAAEDPALAAACARLGVTFLGPSVTALRHARDRVAMKTIAEQAGMPIVAWSGGAVESPASATAAAAALGYPVMLKAAAGGGWSGIRRVDDDAALLAALDPARADAMAAFGDATLYLEALVDGARHLEVVAIADGHGTVWTFGPQDATLRRRGDRIVIESPAPNLAAADAVAVRTATATLLSRIGYRGAATAAYLHRPGTGGARFLELYPRLPPEPAVTEETTGVDLVALQLHVGAGGRLDHGPPEANGHAMLARLNAEDPERGFAPAPGRVTRLRLGLGPGIRVDATVGEGDVLAADDPMLLAQVSARGATREQARLRLRRALAETTVVIDGGSSNKGFVLGVLDRPEVRAAAVDNAFIDRLAAQGEIAVERDADVALLVAAIDAYENNRRLDEARFFASARRGRPRTTSDVGQRVELRYRDQSYRLTVTRRGPRTYSIDDDGTTANVTVEGLGPYERRVGVGERWARAVSAVQGGEHLVELDGTPHRFRREDQVIIAAPTPGMVVAVNVAAGDRVAAGDPVAVIESMKMETAVAAPFAGRVRRLFVAPNEQVDSGAPLVQLEESEPDALDGERPTARLALPATDREPADAAARCRRDLELLRGLMLGYDVDGLAARAAAADLAAARQALGPDGAGGIDLGTAEEDLVVTFADLRELFRGEREPGDDSGGEELQVRAPQERLHAYLRSLDVAGEGLPAEFLAALRRALGHYGVDDLERTPALEEALYWIHQSQRRVGAQIPVIVDILERWLEEPSQAGSGRRQSLDRLIAASQRRYPIVADLAREVRFAIVDEPPLRAARDAVFAEMDEHLAALVEAPDGPGREAHMTAIVTCAQPLAPRLVKRLAMERPDTAAVALEAMTRRYYRWRHPREVRRLTSKGRVVVAATITGSESESEHVLSTAAPLSELDAAIARLVAAAAGLPEGEPVSFDVYTWEEEHDGAGAELSGAALAALLEPTLTARPERVVVALSGSDAEHHIGSVWHWTFVPSDDGLVEDESLCGLHPLMAERLQLWRLTNFIIERLPSAEDVHLYRAVARANPKDQRLMALGEVRDLTPVRDEEGSIVALPQLERVLFDALEGIRRVQAPLTPDRRFQWNRVVLFVWPPFMLTDAEIERVARVLAPATEGLGLEEVVVQCERPDPGTGGLAERAIRLANPAGTGFVVVDGDPPTEPLVPLDEYTQKVVQARRRNVPYPYELVKLLVAPRAGGRADVRGGSFREHDLDGAGWLVPVDRPPGRNTAGIVVGVVTTVTDRYPEGMARVALFGDPTKALGSLAEPECRRIMAAMDLAETLGVPLEWFALSAGARIAMDSGTENMDWIAAVLRRIIEFTQAGRELNVVVTGINVGAQPYWNAEATMLMHTRGILVMTPDSAMVLTGKQALDYSGSVSADDNLGIGGYERIMGPNGQGQYWAPDLPRAIGILLAHYDHAYVLPGERFPRRATTSDPSERDVRTFPHRPESGPIRTVGDIFSDTVNPERKLPFDIHAVMRAVADQDHDPLERWADLAGGDTVVAWDTRIGGWPVALLGIEGRALRRRGFLGADGPDQWTSGTLFPLSSKKAARVINSASGNRPVVVLANLAGFDGSPQSMRSLQLEFGAEIGRAVVNFRGPIVFVVVSRYHGGAFVVFSQKLNADLETVAVEGAHASVLGGAPAAAVVFAGEVAARTRADERVVAVEAKAAAADGAERVRLRAAAVELAAAVHSEKLGEVAAEFDRIHSVERARDMGSVSAIIPAVGLRPYLIDAIARGVARAEARTSSPPPAPS